MDNLEPINLSDMDGYPKNAVFAYDKLHRYPSRIPWLFEAISHSELYYMLAGALKALTPKGKNGYFLVRDILSPAALPKATFYESEHGNWHIGEKEGSHVMSVEELAKMNARGYSYFQDERYFVAVCRDDERESLPGDMEQYILYVFKKAPRLDNVPRAQQD